MHFLGQNIHLMGYWWAIKKIRFFYFEKGSNNRGSKLCNPRSMTVHACIGLRVAESTDFRLKCHYLFISLLNSLNIYCSK
jgi:hypothetical protein